MNRRRAARTRGEAGSATVYVLAGCLLLGIAAMLPAITGRFAIARHRAAVTSDLAAVAGAHSADVGALGLASQRARAALTARGCLAAARVAELNRARLSSCRLVGCGASAGSLQVRVDVAVPWAGLALAGGRVVDAVARAGPVTCRTNSPPSEQPRRNLGSGAPQRPPDR